LQIGLIGWAGLMPQWKIYEHGAGRLDRLRDVES
jgi:hypothetical protein